MLFRTNTEFNFFPVGAAVWRQGTTGPSRIPHPRHEKAGAVSSVTPANCLQACRAPVPSGKLVVPLKCEIAIMKKFVVALALTLSVCLAPARPKVVAYVPNWVDLDSLSANIQYAKLTHINIAFENPDASGDLTFNPQNDILIARAHAHQVQVLVSIGGGAASGDQVLLKRYAALLTDDQRADFVARIVDYVSRHNFDGLDVDIEGPSIGQDYGSFIHDLSLALQPKGKLLTAALSQGYGGGKVPAAVFGELDFVNIMAYDGTGPWEPQSPGQHSSFAFTTNNVLYWLQRGLPKAKAVVGVPFYGYGFGKAFRNGDYGYAKILAAYPGAEKTDQVGETIWYNGIPTIASKTQYVVDQGLGGIMIWSLDYDVQDERSLLSAIHKSLTIASTNCGGQGSTPEFQVIAFYSGKNDLAHISYVQEANQWFPKMAMKYNFKYDATTNWNDLNADFLSRYQIVVFLDSRPETPAQREAFQQYMETGGAWLGFHFAAFALTPSAYPQNWDWYHNQFLGSGEYVSNTWRPTSATLRVEDPTHPATGHLPATFKSSPNEWYRWSHDLRTNADIKILLSIDPASFPLGTGPKQQEIWHGGHYPVVWTNTKYRMLYVNMGHNDLDYEHKFDNSNKSLSFTFENEVQNRLILDGLLWLGARK